MLDQETKKKINDLRDTLVGKVPDPKSQVEQIMIALIYKFMNDMDKESTDLGGEASFFVGDFEKYSWDNLFGTKVSGSELVNLYSTAVESMEENPNIPQLFRDIFKNAYIPYKDAETLRLFLSQIDDFEYSKDSEQLGDAFEHILNSLSSQGDAGQFRTPRHIIDFIVEIVDPKKDETVLDPASGTSGFLISAFKHIVNSNSEKSSGDLLSAAERKKIMENINGYDISPDMVRIGLANMYLHGFPEPNVVEYDALTSEDRWNEYYDVILANPPFMTPKGGIRPHNKFGLKSNRAEVLFVDYILTHLKPKGRAGIIVPEGIIFQSGKAYKELRKKLVENGLAGVISLPAGVFNPYSGVKTSVLIIDKFSKSEEVYFADIKNDGFDLGSNRLPIDGSELPSVIKEIGLKHKENSIVHTISKKEITEKEYNLTFNSYIDLSENINTDYKVVSLKEVLVDKPQYGSGAKKANFDNKIRYIRITDINTDGSLNYNEIVSPSEVEDKYLLEKFDILIARSASVGRSYLHLDISMPAQFAGYLIRFPYDKEKILPKYLFSILNSSLFGEFVNNKKKDGTISNINAQEYQEFNFPLPPLEKQQEIVDEIEQYQKVIDGARQVKDNYSVTFDYKHEFEGININEIAELKRGSTITQKQTKQGDVPVIGGGQKPSYFHNESNRGKGFITISSSGAYAGFVNIWDTPIYASDCFTIKSNNEEKFLTDFIFIYLKSLQNKIYSMTTGAAQPHVYIKDFKDFNIPNISIVEQKDIVNNYRLEKEIISSNLNLINNFEIKINNIIEKLYKK